MAHFTFTLTATRNLLHRCMFISGRERCTVCAKGRVPPTVIYLPYRAFPAQHLRPSGVFSCWSDGLELSRILSGIPRAAQTVLCVYLKCTCSHSSASSAIEVLNDNALHKSTHALTHSRVSNRVGVSCRNGESTISFNDVIDFRCFKRRLRADTPTH